MSIFKKTLYVLSWIPVALLSLVLILMGLIMVPLGLLINKDSSKWFPPFWLWGNDEEGVPEWWYRDVREGDNFISERFPGFWWLAIRNPVGNFRFLFKDRDAHIETNWSTTVPMEAQQMIDAEQPMAYRWAWDGFFAGYRRVWLNKHQDKYSEIWFGWKLGSKVPGLGFTTQVRLNREIGK